MSLRTSSPYRHPKTGVYWFRRAVPERLRPLIGKTIYQRSLRTKDVNDARAKFAVVAAEVAQRWDALSVEPGRLTQMQRWGVSGEYYRWFVARHRDAPAPAGGWEAAAQSDISMIKPAYRRPSTAGKLMTTLPEFLVERGIPVDKADHGGMRCETIRQLGGGPVQNRQNLGIEDHALAAHHPLAPGQVLIQQGDLGRNQLKSELGGDP